MRYEKRTYSDSADIAYCTGATVNAVGGHYMENSENRFPEELVQIRIQADSSYQIKRIMENLKMIKGFELMSESGIKRNNGAGPKLRLFATLKDLKAEKKKLQKKNRYNKFN